VAALMMIPKTWRDPHSETQATFVLAAGSGALAVAAVGDLSVRLLAYPAYFALVNALLGWVIGHRRRVRRVDVSTSGVSSEEGSREALVR
jgi:hypothetical protein